MKYDNETGGIVFETSDGKEFFYYPEFSFGYKDSHGIAIEVWYVDEPRVNKYLELEVGVDWVWVWKSENLISIEIKLVYIIW